MHISGPLEGSIVQLDNIIEQDLPDLWEILFNDDHPEWKKWETTHLPLQSIEYVKFHEQMINLIKQGLDKQFSIKVNNEIIGIIFYDWEHESSNSLEVGVAIYRRNYMDGSFETDALKTWMNHLFTTFPIPRIGLTTWSGNERMLSIGKKIGMMVEGRIRKNRLYRGKYYDTVKLGILREEWELHLTK